MKPEETNFYKPDDSEAPKRPTPPKSTKQTVSWTASEFIEHQRGTSWYVMLFVVTFALAAIIYFVIHDYFAVGVTIILGGIVAFYAGQKPGQTTYEVSSSGIKVGERPYAYNNFKSFSMIHMGNLTSLNFYPLKRLSVPITAFLDPKDEARITEIIGQHLPIDEGRTDKFDNLARRLKL